MVGTVVGLQPAPTNDRRIAPPATWRAPSPGVRWVVLVSVALGLVLGAMACASVMGTGAPHGAHGLRAATVTPSAAASVHVDDHAGGHGARNDASPSAVATESTAAAQPARDGEPSGATTAGSGHPGMACATAVDLRFPEAIVDVVSDHVDVSPIAMNPSCSSDIDPPVPRVS